MYHHQFPMILGRAQRVLERTRRELFIASKPLQLRYAVTEQHLDFEQKNQLDYQEAPEGGKGFVWGSSGELVWRSAWFHAEVDLRTELPQWQEICRKQARDSEGSEELEIALDLSFSGEGLVFDREGQIVQGISGGSVLHHHFERSVVMRAADLLQDGKLEIWIEAAANTLFGLERDDDPGAAAPRCPHYYGEHQGKVYSAQIALFDKALWRYLLDLESATQLAQNLLKSRAAGKWGSIDGEISKTASPRAKRLIFAIDQSLSCHAYQRANLKRAHEILQAAFCNDHAPSDLKTVAVGHAHIDTAWLWPVRETVRKCARTFANQLRLMEHYPSYVFGASQAQHYAFVQRYYPEIYQKVKQRVQQGRWEVQGAMWVEADASVPSGESLVRQILHGKNYFMDEFGVDVQNLWLPDVFGYSANLPQILQRAGVHYFLTQKLSWSEYNDFPHHTFHWRGLDGSSVLTHFPPEATYNSTLTLGGIHGLGLSAAQDSFKEAHILQEFMTLYGVGDGGGGPDEAMIERGLSLAKGVESAPRVEFGRADDFFERLREKSADLPHWSGELYFELHRGTLTTQARTKRGNRRLEQALRNVEYLYSLSYSGASEQRAEGAYPQAQLDAIWKTLLINQFHDIIPGSSIHEVYRDTEIEHAEALAQCQNLIAQWASSQLCEAETWTLINPFSLPMQVLVQLPETWAGAVEQDQKSQNGSLGTESQLLGSEAGYALLRLAPQAILSLAAGPAKSIATERAVQVESQAERGDAELKLQNDLVCYCFNSRGQLVRAWDKELSREILAQEGLGNRLRLYRDWPRDWDAWDIDINYQAEILMELEAERAEILPGNGLRQQLCFYYDCGQSSRVQQTVSLEANSKRLEFANRVDWQERHSMLRVSFEPDIYGQRASYDIQYAYLERATHRNTSWEMAQFEVVGQRYADLSDKDYGVALLNDCKYGYQVIDNWMDLNLLRSPTLPDPDADRGTHEFRYALLPHCGSLEQAMPQIQAEAARLNCEIVPLAGQPVSPTALEAPVQVYSDNVSLEVLKKAEKSDDLIVRLVERAGRKSPVKIRLHKGYRQLQECDLMEWNDIGLAIPCSLAAGELVFEPFAVRTFRLQV